MALGQGYAQQDCSLARALEIVGDRWTMLVLRDCFFGVRRFNDLQAHLDVPRAVLGERLARLVEAGVLTREPYAPRRDEYLLTGRGRALWPALYSLSQWGEAATGSAPRRLYRHVRCAVDIDPTGLCRGCGGVPPPGELEMRPGPGLKPAVRADPVGVALRRPHRLLEPLFADPKDPAGASA